MPKLLEHARHADAPHDYRDEPWFTLWSALWLLSGSIELERALPEGAAPAPVPADLRSAYGTALQEGGELAKGLLAEKRDVTARRALTIAYAAFSGDVGTARLLGDETDS